ncbi:LTA synthase family protein [Pedobacter arcticus]|uniref:LTA synthase family protein n=1 Tax=Pedobacter arcticus TaxID=752140 RepID=UPI0003107C8F|nr:alkaline phosphatase family protein [Pedobacter arcticus]
MLKSLSFFVRYFIFWVLFFVLNKVVFELWNFKKLTEFSFIDILKTFGHGLHMDASMAGYFCALPFLLVIIAWFFNKSSISLKSIHIYSYILVVITAITAIIDVNIYREWGTKLNYKAIGFFIDSPKEAVASSSSSPIFSNIIGFLVLAFLGILMYRKLFPQATLGLNKARWIIKPIISFLIIGLTFLAIRGSLTVAPMNTSRVYFSQHQILNIAAINTNWFLISNILSQSKIKGNPYLYFKPEEAIAIKDSLFNKSVEFPLILNTSKPNIVLIILESFTADVIKEIGPEKNVTPNFSKLIAEGLLFTNIYSASDRTDKGIVAILSGFPSQATESIIKTNDKQVKLPSISQEVKNIGYHTSFIYGGDLNFANFKSYLISHGFENVKDVNDIKTNEKLTKWGVADDVTMTTHLKDLKAEKQPFFTTLLTLSNHEPFYLKGKYKFGDKTVSNMFRSTAFYTDSILYDYVNQAKKQAWYNNTLFILVADHGHRLPTEQNDIFEPGRYHIPILFFGGALKTEFKNQRVEKVGAQVDLASTLLNQLNLSDTAFHYSKNLLSPAVKGFAFYSWNNGFGFINENKKAVSFDPIGKQLIYEDKFSNEKAKFEALKNSKALMQTIYTDYMKY